MLIHPTKIQAARAANVTYVMMQYRRETDREELNPVSFWQLTENKLNLEHLNKLLPISITKGFFFRITMKIKNALSFGEKRFTMGQAVI